MKAEPASKARVLAWIAGAAAAAGGVALLFFFAPEEHPFYPRCLLRTVTGLQCPGCGGLRAVHHLLHGNLAVAFHYNPLVVLLLPGLAAAAACLALRRVTGRPIGVGFNRPVWLWLIVGALLAFGIWRNSPLAR
jgi:hypothetical protein